MKLIYAADIHGAIEKVKTLLYETVADAYIVSGDLIDIPFYSMETAIRYHDIQTFFHGLRGRMGKTDMVIEDFVDERLTVGVGMDNEKPVVFTTSRRSRS